MSAEILPLIDFSKVKKKKRLEEPENEDQDDQELGDIVLKKKGKKKVKKNVGKNENDIKERENEEPNNNTNGLYPYEFLLDRIYNKMRESAMKEQNNISLKLPNIDLKLLASKKTMWSNFETIANVLGRSKDHLFNYIKDELRVEGTIGGKGEIYIKGAGQVTEKILKNTLSKYISDYVKCPVCKSYKTQLRKDPSTRLLQIYCEDCKGERTIQPIKSRTTEGKRKK